MYYALKMRHLTGTLYVAQKETEGRRLQLQAAVMAQSMKVLKACLLEDFSDIPGHLDLCLFCDLQ